MKGLRSPVGLVVPFTHFAQEPPVELLFGSAGDGGVVVRTPNDQMATVPTPRVTPALTAWLLSLCLATAMSAWQAGPDKAAAGAPHAEAPGQSNPVVKESSGLAAPPISLPDHRIQPGDLLSVSVFDEPTLSKITRVDADGLIALPVVTKKLQTAGLMPHDVEAAVTRELLDEKILLHPSVSISILEYAERMVTVVGNVRNPGEFKITAPITVLEALAKAGWITSDAASDLLLTAPGAATPRKINIDQLLRNSGPANNVSLSGGELINVPDVQKELAAKFPEGPKVWITGNVSNPQAYSIANAADASVLKAVTSVLGAASTDKIAFIYRAGKQGKRYGIQVPLREILQRKAQDMPLQANDVLFIPGDNDKKVQQYYETHPPSPPWEGLK